MADKKKFGLLIPKKSGAIKLKKSSIFDEDSDGDEINRKRPKIPLKEMQSKSKIKTEAIEDPSIYEYDNIYDEMKSKQAASIAPKEKKNSRYIDTLLKAADKRKKEYERRLDRKIQVEREKEGDKYKDKEAFVTSAYKKKMEEQEAEEERERRENMLNDMMDVSKQKDLSGFYRHFLKQTVGEEKVPIFGEKQIKKEISSEEEYSSHDKQGNSSKNRKKADSEKGSSTRKSGKSYCDVDTSSPKQCRRSKDIKDSEMDSDTEDSSQKVKGNSKNSHKTQDSAATGSEDDSYESRDNSKTTKQSHSRENASQKNQILSSEYKDIDQDSDGIEIDSDDDSTHRKHSKTNKDFCEINKKVSFSKKIDKSSKGYKNADLNRDEVEIDSDDMPNKNNEKDLPNKTSNEKDCENIDQDSDGIEIDSDDDKDKIHQRKSFSKIFNSKSKIMQSIKNIRASNRKSSEESDSSDDEKEHLHTKYKHSNQDTKYDSNLSRHDSSSSNEDDKKENKKTADVGRDRSPCEKVLKKNIYEKRTVGEIFAEAQARYFQRMAARKEGIC